MDESWKIPEQDREIIIPKKYLENGNNAEKEVMEIERPEERVRRYEALEMVTAALKYFPINVYNDIFNDVVGHETFAGSVQCAYQNGVLPDYIQEREELKPLEYISGKEFMDYIETGLRGRTDSQYIVPEEMKKVVDENYEIKRKEASALLQIIKI